MPRHPITVPDQCAPAIVQLGMHVSQWHRDIPRIILFLVVGELSWTQWTQYGIITLVVSHFEAGLYNARNLLFVEFPAAVHERHPGSDISRGHSVRNCYINFWFYDIGLERVMFGHLHCWLCINLWFSDIPDCQRLPRAGCGPSELDMATRLIESDTIKSSSVVKIG